MIIIALLLKVPPPQDAGKPLMYQLRQIDPIGALVFVPGIVCLLLALQWGGSTYQWKDGRISALLVLAGFLLLLHLLLPLFVLLSPVRGGFSVRGVFSAFRPADTDIAPAVRESKGSHTTHFYGRRNSLFPRSQREVPAEPGAP